VGIGLINEGHNLPAGIAAIALGWLAGSGIFAGIVRGSRKAIQKLADDLEARVRELVTPEEESQTQANLQERLNEDA
jgi:hypothetical protein